MQGGQAAINRQHLSSDEVILRPQEELQRGSNLVSCATAGQQGRIGADAVRGLDMEARLKKAVWTKQYMHYGGKGLIGQS